MQIIQLDQIEFIEKKAHAVSFQGSGGERLTVSILDDDLIRVQHWPDGQTRFGRTWTILGEDGSVPFEGRLRDEVAHFPRPEYSCEQTSQAVMIQTADLQLEVNLEQSAIQWKTKSGEPFARDLAQRAYPYDAANGQVFHYLERFSAELYYGFGEVSGGLVKNGRRLRFFNVDAMGYNAETSNPLYKHWPFYITYNPELNIAYGLFYDNYATTEFDLGQEINNYYPGYRSYRADGGDVDYYLIHGPTIEAVIEKFTALTGRINLPPRWSLGYLGSTMRYTEMPNAQEELKQFVDLCLQHDIPCDLFHLSSGYSMGEDGKRYVFEWNHNRVPDPPAMSEHFRQAGINLAANIKPALLTSHPKFDAVAEFGGFINTREQPSTGSGLVSNPRLDMFWGGDGAHLDFTNAKTVAWWQGRVLETLLANGINSTWNDNNEYTIEDDTAVCAGFGEPIALGLARPLQTLLMMKASYDVQVEHQPDKRPFLISRSGCVGMQRYAQTWSGDNATNWHSMKFNIPMGLSASLSGMQNNGHDVGGFHGPKPDPEMFVRWIQTGIFEPRFTIHSWNTDQSANEPWMHPEVLPLVRDAIHLRYRLLPYLYSLFVESAETGHPIIRPMVYHFAHDPHTHFESFDFVLGPNLLVASVLEPNARQRDIYLPTNTEWVDFYTGDYYQGGQIVTLEAPLERIPLLVQAGGIIPMGKVMRHVGAEADDVRQLLLFPHQNSGSGQFALVEDDGVTLAYRNGARSTLHLSLTTTSTQISLGIDRVGDYDLPYQTLELILPPNEQRTLFAKKIIKQWVDDQQRPHAVVDL